MNEDRTAFKPLRDHNEETRQAEKATEQSHVVLPPAARIGRSYPRKVAAAVDPEKRLLLPPDTSDDNGEEHSMSTSFRHPSPSPRQQPKKVNPVPLTPEQQQRLFKEREKKHWFTRALLRLRSWLKGNHS